MAGIAVLLALSVWQFERRIWKLDLIAHVDQRVHGTPVAAPGPAEWAGINAGHDAYRHIALHGHYLNDRETLVQASTARGVGFWALTPLQTDQGFIVLINRGFVPQNYSARTGHADSDIIGDTDVTGLLRISEPKGRIFRTNDPAHHQWYSRDVIAIATAQNLDAIAPYFVDADADAMPHADGYPIGGLTVIAFPNNHLVYALTWLGLALILAASAFMVAREEYRLRRTSRPQS